MGESPHRAVGGQSLLRGYTGRLLALVAACSLTTIGGQAVIAPLLPAIIDDLGITSSQAGVALTGMAALSAICRYPGGRLADHLSRKTVLAVAIGAMATGFAVLAVTPAYPVFLAGVVIVGTGAGLYLPSAFALLSDLFVSRRGQAIGINNAAVNLGGILASGLAVVVLARATWRAAFVPVVAIFVVLLVLMHHWNDEPYVLSRVQFHPLSTARRLLGESRIRWMVTSAALVMFVQRGSVAFIPLFLQAEKNFSTTLAGSLYAGFFLVGMLSTPLTGWVGDRIGHTTVVLGATVAGIVGLGVLLVGDTPASMAVGVVVFALGLMGFWPGMNAYVLALFPDDSMGGDFGALGVFYLGVGSLGPAYVGFAAEQTTYLLAFAGLVPLLLASTGLNAWLAVRS